MSGMKRTFQSDNTERRVQPRHFHHEFNHAAQSVCVVVLDNVSTLPATRLYRHALESIFKFLTFNELALALRVSNEWLSAVKTMAGLEWEKQIPHTLLLSTIVDSVMVRHLTSVGSVDGRVHLNADSLFIMARHMQHVQQLTCTLSPPSVLGLSAFPYALRNLNISVTSPATSTGVNVILKAIGRVSQLEILELWLPGVVDPQMSFAPLAPLTQLRRLSINWSGSVGLSTAHLDELRTIPHLQRLCATRMSTRMLRHLLRQPHNLQWQHVEIPACTPLTDESASLLVQLPSLTKLDGWSSCTRFDWLQQLPNLIVVDLGFKHDELSGTEWIESLVMGLQQCPSITSLDLSQCRGLTTAHLIRLLPRLLQLHSLALVDIDIESLSFLTLEPMTRQLTSLGLWDCLKLSITELRHVHVLGALKSLTLENSFTSPLDQYSQLLLTPPSIVLPKLDEFSYVPPR